MFLLDSLMISGIQWALKTVVTAAEAEMNDDSALRDRLLEAEMQREMGEMSDEEFADIEADLLRSIREIKERRDGGSGAFAFGGGEPMEAGDDSRFQVEAELSGDYHGDDAERWNDPAPAGTSDLPIPVVAPVAATAPGKVNRRNRTKVTRTRALRARRSK